MGQSTLSCLGFVIAGHDLEHKLIHNGEMLTTVVTAIRRIPTTVHNSDANLSRENMLIQFGVNSHECFTRRIVEVNGLHSCRRIITLAQKHLLL
jgi:hypothetical protein